MTFLRPGLILILMLSTALTAHAAEPADSTIKNALADIARFEQQAQGLTPARAANAKRILRLLEVSHERLQSSSHQSDPSWQEADQRFTALKTQLQQLTEPGSAAPSAAAVASAPAPATPPPAVASASTAPALASGQRVQVKKLIRDITAARERLVGDGPSPFQAPQEVSARQKRLKQFEEALARYPQLDDPDVQTARAAYEQLRQALSAEFQRAREQLAQLGDAQQRLATIEANSRTYPVPAVLTVPFTQADAAAWADAAGKARTVAEHNLKELQAIAPLAYLPNNPGTPQTGAPYDAQDVDRLQRNSQAALQQLQQGYEQMAADLTSRLTQIENDVLTRFRVDPSGERAWIYLRKESVAEADRTFADALAQARSAVFLEESLGRDASAAKAVIAKIEQARQAFTDNRSAALSASRLPEAKSRNKEMLAIAKKIVENPKYEFGEYGPIVLTTGEVVERERKDSEIEIDDADITLSGELKMSGTQTTWTYKWKEFKFAVPLKEAGTDDWHVWWITAKNFSSGGSRTPLNTWVSGEATQGNRILRKNF